VFSLSQRSEDLGAKNGPEQKTDFTPSDQLLSCQKPVSGHNTKGRQVGCNLKMLRGKTVMTQLLPLVIKHLHNGINEIAAVVNRKNNAAIKVLERSGLPVPR
jgi:hypothetical protein